MSTETLPAPSQPHGHDDAHGHGGHASEPAPDDTPVNVTSVVAVGLISVALFAAGAVWALKIQANTIHAMNPNGPAPIPQTLPAEEHGIVDAVPFELNHWKADEVATAREILTTYAWIDKKTGTVRIPIDRAMELVVAEQAKWAIPPPGEPKPLAPKAAETKIQRSYK